jgi:hypothetical protein
VDTPRFDEGPIFNAARQIKEPAERCRYIGEAGGDDLALAGRVEALLRAHNDFLPTS